MRLTITRAVVGDLGSASHLAKVRRELSAFFGSGWRKAGTPAVTALVGLSQSPRRSRWVSRGCSRASNVREVAPSGYSFQRSSIFAFASFHSGTVVRQ